MSEINLPTVWILGMMQKYDYYFTKLKIAYNNENKSKQVALVVVKVLCVIKLSQDLDSLTFLRAIC